MKEAGEIFLFKENTCFEVAIVRWGTRADETNLMIKLSIRRVSLVSFKDAACVRDLRDDGGSGRHGDHVSLFCVHISSAT